jgi:RNAse (barnase) inhibitor barstar
MYYEKPSEKQEGVVMEHMGDMVKYYSQLEALHASVDAVSRNLDNAFDCVSRQITLCLPVAGKDIDTIDKKVTKASNDFSAEILSSADGIPWGSSDKSRQRVDSKISGKKIGTVDWKDI